MVWAASMSKIVTIAGVMSLVERGIVSLDDDMRTIVPELSALQILRGFTDDEKPVLEDNSLPITLRYHSSAVPSHIKMHAANPETDIS